ncbi:MAG: HyaD/HybD family hydrogenase maturation endopeptidase [Deltaproteobacteria bacterium]|jgi:hydrogenase maturation protease|nr:HyaD/HybD family hydrogenase maturation endopeptidase [Deltaproteobacteria bacterium]MCL5880390.1 HyaD/HybD family hydrogenase maturation endopeptidase [Deltaproteobacteria bacterium]MDA8303788.1 HyaD/HybD family hydrogenase maturation endopeptidase [Deltaproteobacteria bacterium]
MTGIIGIGNLLLKDEGFGIHFVHYLRKKYIFGLNLRIIDGSTMGYGLLDDIFNLDNIIVIDAIKTDEKPGSIFKFDGESIPVDLMKKTAHDVEFIDVITMCSLQGHNPRITIFAISPEDIINVGMDISPPLKNAMPHLEALVLEEIKPLGIEWSINPEYLQIAEFQPLI